MEIERYTLATGETVLRGFSRFWRHWGLILALFVYVETIWPGWAASSATIVTYLFGGHATWITMAMLVVIGAMLTLAPVIYTALERVAFLKIGLIVLFGAVAVAVAISPKAWSELPRNVTAPQLPIGLGLSVILTAIVFAATGGGANLAQSNWIREKRYGMGAYVPRLVSPVTGKQEPTGARSGYVFEPTEENLRRWRRWWRLANWEQLVTFVLITLAAIVVTSLLAFSTVSGVPGLANSIAFLRVEGVRLKETVGPWFGVLFWVIGVFSLFATATGTVDFTSRLAADVLKTSYLRRIPENRIYFVLVWGLVAFGCVIMLRGIDTPLVLLQISATVASVNMSSYSVLLIVLNRRVLADQIRPRLYRVAALTWSAVLFGGFAVLAIWQQGERLLRAWLR
jgi:hypothetical protein